MQQCNIFSLKSLLHQQPCTFILNSGVFVEDSEASKILEVTDTGLQMKLPARTAALFQLASFNLFPYHHTYEFLRDSAAGLNRFLNDSGRNFESRAPLNGRNIAAVYFDSCCRLNYGEKEATLFLMSAQNLSLETNY